MQLSFPVEGTLPHGTVVYGTIATNPRDRRRVADFVFFVLNTFFCVCVYVLVQWGF